MLGRKSIDKFQMEVNIPINIKAHKIHLYLTLNAFLFIIKLRINMKAPQTKTTHLQAKAKVSQKAIISKDKTIT